MKRKKNQMILSFFFFFLLYLLFDRGFPWGSVSKDSACTAGDAGSIPGQEDPLEEDMAAHASILAWRIP